jgi:hypothetical protein
MSALPSVTFSAQSTVPTFPNELHECIEMTPALQAWAANMLPAIRQRAADAKQAERAALHVAHGEASWRAAGGPSAAHEADHLAHVAEFIKMLSEGRAASSYYGWVDRREWLNITRTIGA